MFAGCIRRLPLFVLLVAVAHVPAAGEGPPQVRELTVDLDDGPVRALCTEGSHRVLLLPGDRAAADEWRPVLSRLAGRVGACAYDRATDREEGTSEGRGWFELLDEMRRVQDALGLGHGYTLVGKGTAGMYARLYAGDRPLDVGGLVLIDPVHEDMPEEARRGMPQEAWSAWMSGRRRPNADGVRETELSRHARETSLRDIPVTVVTPMQWPDGDGWDGRYLFEAARRVHASILRGVRSGRHIPVPGTGDGLLMDHPDLVAREIERIAGMTSRGER